MGASRKEANGMRISYDPSTDTLYILSKNMRKSVARDMGKGILVQYSLVTNQPVGAIIHDFKQRFENHEKTIKIPFMDFVLESA